ncbi:AglZ/HisF2 family acetamidino modification protein [Vibrio amylolyticus]|uniref:AglZ/HisF2 family acetamidino modification protein n=1 Tax=Vibrio amylolyticus TaxID=2847292 RepID=UPI003553F3E6
MLKQRVIPCLLLKGEGLVKTKQYKKARYVGDPINAVRIFNDKEVDELIILDIEASRLGNGPNFRLIEDVASECFMPLCYGGGIRTLEDAEKLFHIGIEKVCIQTSVISDLSLVTEISNKFGSQSVVVSVDVKSTLFGKNKLYNASSGKVLSGKWEDRVQNIQAAGAGELVLSYVNNDGMCGGMNLSLIERASTILDIPVIAIGGVGSLEDIRKAAKRGASAIAAGAFFVFQAPHDAVLITYPKYKDLEELLKGI